MTKQTSQNMAPFGLLGRKLGHSWSPQIHARLGSVPYELHELEPEELAGFVRGGSWRGLNVTIPYKREAAAARRRGERARAASGRGKHARPPYRRNHLRRQLRRLGLCLDARALLPSATSAAPRPRRWGRGSASILGSGGASQAIRAALEDAGARVVTISRTGGETYETLAERHADATLMVNTTPVGMYPNCPATPVSREVMAQLEGLAGVLDIVYNPERTELCLIAEELGIPSESGLAMLVGQARFSSELFQGHAIEDELLEKIEDELRSLTRNVVLIGMPGAGKTSCGKRLARMLGRPFVDIDEAILADTGRSAAQIIQEDGEDAFRRVETEVTASYCKRSGMVIACGGGVVTRPQNRDLLRQNGRVVLVDRPLDELSDKGRPVSQAKGVERLAAERMHLYHEWADVVAQVHRLGAK